MDNKKSFFERTVELIIFFTIIIVLLIILDKTTNIFSDKKPLDDSNSKLPTINNTPPVVDEIMVASSTEPKIKTSSKILIAPADNYQVPNNPYDSETYKNASRRLALEGDFEIAKLHIKGSLPTKDYYVLSINIGTESGIYNAVRNSPDGLDLDLTKENRGVFSSDDPIDIEIDLLGQQTLSTTKDEFLNTRKTTKLIRFWNFIQPPPPAPSVNRILFVPFSKSGEYAGSIESLEFEYLCKNGGTCKVAVCGNDELTTVCLKNNFGLNSANEWCQLSNAKGCENL